MTDAEWTARNEDEPELLFSFFLTSFPTSLDRIKGLWQGSNCCLLQYRTPKAGKQYRFWRVPLLTNYARQG